MKGLLKISDGIDKVASFATLACIIGYLIVMLAQVILRNLAPRHALSWADGVCRYFFIWASFLGASLAFKRRRHIAITTVTDALHGNAKKISTIFNTAVILILLVVTFVMGLKGIKITSVQKSDVLSFMPASVIYASIPVGAGISIFQLIVTFLEDMLAPEKPAGSGSEEADGSIPEVVM